MSGTRISKADLETDIAYYQAQRPDVQTLLNNWGAVAMRAGVMKDPCAAIGSHSTGYDHPLILALYVEETMWFAPTREMLVWHYVEGREISAYPFRHLLMTGEFEDHGKACVRHAVPVGVWGNVHESSIIKFIYARFYRELATKVNTDPPPKKMALHEVDWIPDDDVVVVGNRTESLRTRGYR